MAILSWPIRSWSSSSIDEASTQPRIDFARKFKLECRDEQAMEVRSTPISPGAQGQESARFLIDQGELRSILSNLSHELCRPLVSLRAGFDLLLGESPSTISQDQRGHLATMVSLCDDLLRLTHGYLDYAGIVQGSRPISLGSFTIGALIAEIDRQFGPIALGRQLDWEARAESPESVVVTDVTRCQQIFGNLVSNAVKYTPTGGRVRVTGKADADSWTVIVSDSGPGIPAEALERIFEPFFRLSRDEHSMIEGSGLGLAICRELVTQLHGEISVSSGAGEGTSIAVKFPIPDSGTTRGGSRGESQPVAKRDRPAAGDQRI
jgi:signal transduction histidine kinase